MKSDNPAGSFERLVAIMARLRSAEGCPWDREQTHQTLRPYVIEEAYEVVQALDDGDMPALCDELGDVLLQVVFHAQIASESGAFGVADVCDTISDKLIRRHPHVFADVTVEGPAGVVANWEQIKAAEKGKEAPSILDEIPAHLPALMRSYKLQQRAARVGFDWPNYLGALEKVDEEMDEFRQALDEAGTPEGRIERAGADNRVEEEFGDLLFALVNTARFLGIDPEVALNRTNHKFTRRFARVEQGARTEGRNLEDMSLPEMDRYWNAAKEEE